MIVVTISSYYKIFKCDAFTIGAVYKGLKFKSLNNEKNLSFYRLSRSPRHRHLR